MVSPLYYTNECASLILNNLFEQCSVANFEPPNFTRTDLQRIKVYEVSSSSLLSNSKSVRVIQVKEFCLVKELLKECALVVKSLVHKKDWNFFSFFERFRGWCNIWAHKVLYVKTSVGLVSFQQRFSKLTNLHYSYFLK